MAKTVDASYPPSVSFVMFALPFAKNAQMTSMAELISVQ
jgi:hypothetical protein